MVFPIFLGSNHCSRDPRWALCSYFQDSPTAVLHLGLPTSPQAFCGNVVERISIVQASSYLLFKLQCDHQWCAIFADMYVLLLLLLLLLFMFPYITSPNCFHVLNFTRDYLHSFYPQTHYRYVCIYDTFWPILQLIDFGATCP